MARESWPPEGTLVYYVFDLLKLGDVDLRGEPFLRRKRLLEKLVSGNLRILYVDHMEEGLAMFAGALALGLGRCGREGCEESLRRRSRRYSPLAENQESRFQTESASGVSSEQATLNCPSF